MIHSSRWDRKTKAIAEALAMLDDAHPELAGISRPSIRGKTKEFCILHTSSFPFLGTYETVDEAIAACRGIVDRSLKEEYRPVH